MPERQRAPATRVFEDLSVTEQVAFLNSVLESSTEYSIIALDPDCTIVAWNEGARRIYGYETGEVVGRRSSFDLHDPADVQSERAAEIVEDVKRTGKWEGELKRRRKDGSIFRAHVTKMLRRDHSGRSVGFTLVSRDLTDTDRILQQLRESQEYNRGLIESNIDALMTTDPLGIITDVNRQMCEVTGRSREELVGTPFKDYFTEPQRAEDGIRKVLAEDRVTNYELTIRGKDGKEAIVSYNATTFKGADGRLRGVFAAARDITEQKRLEGQITKQYSELGETTNFLNNILQSSTEYSIIAKDLTGNILAWNEGARRTYGYDAEEMVGKQNSRILHTREDCDSGRVDAALATALETGKFEGEFQRARKTGEQFTAQVAITLRRDPSGRPIGYLLISKDITEQKALEEQLRRKNEELIEQYRRVQEANRLKSEFLANMSHELRTPLNAVIGFAELMHDGKVGPVSNEHKEYLGDILTSSRHLLRLINDVLDLAKVESGKMEFRPEPVEMARLAREVKDILRTLAASKRIDVQTEVDPSVTGVVADPAKLKQVLYNYLSNALKFTPDEGRVTIRVRPESADAFRLEVQDTGIGIRPEDMGRLFVEFQQLDASMAKKYQGTGLGLALTKRIIEAQGGRVGVVSTPGRGSVFFAILPRVVTVAAEQVAAPEIVEPAPPPRRGAPVVLAVEDEAKDRKWLVETLARAGYVVEAAKDGAEALALCRKKAYDAITLDLLLPDMSGREVLRAIRAEGLNVETPVIIVSVLAEKGIGAGFHVHDILMKPVHEEDLLGSLQRAGAPPDGDRPILVLDDDAKELKVAEKTLKRLGYRPVCFQDARQGLKAAAMDPPAAVILDLLMPEMDGFAFLRSFRLTPAGRRTPVIVWTAKDVTAEERERLESSAQAIVLKSEGTAALVEELQAYVPLPESDTHASGGRHAR